MGLHSKFPKSPYEIIDPEVRCFPDDESLRDTSSLHDTSIDQFMPPLVVRLHKKLKNFVKMTIATTLPILQIPECLIG
jgi:type III restriction enzyme